MKKVIKIKEILQFLDSNDFSYEFIGDENQSIDGFSSLFNYKKETITFISTLYKFEDYKKSFSDKSIRLILTDPTENIYESFENIILIKKPTNAFFSIIDYFYSSNENSNLSPYNSSNSLRANNTYVSTKAKIGNNVLIGNGCVIEDNVRVGNNTIIHHNVILKSGTKVGENCIIRSGSIIGGEGFNPTTQLDGTKKLLKHYGGVIIEDNVFIGEKCVIHKGSIDDTLIKSGVKLNSMVHIAHNCIIGENTVVTMPTHISGSVKVGKNCHIAATTIRNQCIIGNNVTLGLGSVVIKNVEDNMTMIGVPAKPLNH